MSSVVAPQDVRFPVGRYVAPVPITEADRREAIRTLAEFPDQLRDAVRGLSEEQLNTPYREGGWTVRQVVHHVADSHSLALHRLKKTLTEHDPEIAGYDQDAFALLPDTRGPVEWPLEVIRGVHARWVFLLERLTEEQLARTYRHSERGPDNLGNTLLMYAWHARHHLGHVTSLRARLGW